MTNVLLATLIEFLQIQKDYFTGNADENNLNETKRRFNKSLSELIDARIQFALDERRKHQSQERILTADSINLAVTSTASTIRSIVALNSAPPPPDNIKDTEDMDRWRQEYNEWYEIKRRNGMTIG